MPINKGQQKPGVKKAPEFFRLKRGLNDISAIHGIPALDYGDFNFPDKMSNIDSLKYARNQLKNNSYFDNELPIFFGGDHSCSLATVSAFLDRKNCDDYCVIWIDAHADCNTFETSPSGNLHGMPVAGLLGKLPEEYSDFKCLASDQVFLFGIRDVDPGEWDFIEKHGLSYSSMEEIKEKGLSFSLDKMANFINGRKVYISWDIDAMEPDLVSSTGTPVENGFSFNDMCRIIDLLSCQDVRGLDVVEFNPDIGDARVTYVTILKVLDHFCKALKKSYLFSHSVELNTCLQELKIFSF